MVELLLKYGAELNPDAPNDRSTYGSWAIDRNPLHPAIRNGNIDMLGFLIDKGADPTDGIFPAVIEEKPEVFRYLLGRGADVEEARKELEDVERGPLLDEMLEKLKLSPE